MSNKHFRNGPLPIVPSKPLADDGWPIPVDADGKPDARALAKRWGGHRNVPSEAWERFDAAMARWRENKTTAKMLSAKGMSTREIAKLTGWDQATIARDIQKARDANASKSDANASAPKKPSKTGGREGTCHLLFVRVGAVRRSLLRWQAHPSHARLFALREIKAMCYIRHVSQRAGGPILTKFISRPIVRMQRFQFVTRP
jgi:hypothetical protein